MIYKAHTYGQRGLTDQVLQSKLIKTNKLRFYLYRDNYLFNLHYNCLLNHSQFIYKINHITLLKSKN